MKYVLSLFFALLWLSFSGLASAQEPPKNVQVLTGLSRTDLLRTMGFMKTALGVRCDFCHVNGGEGGPWHFDSDDKKPKKTARKMIQMVMDINKQYFDGRPVVSCFTCHQGSIKPQLTVSFPLPAPAPPPAAVQTQATEPVLPTSASILDYYYKAIGADQKHPLFWQSIVMKGKREQPGAEPADLEIREKAPDHWLVTVTGKDGTMRQATDGKVAWAEEDGEISAMNPSELQRFQENIHGLQLIPPPMQDYEVKGLADVNQKKAYQLIRHADDHTSESLFFDTDTGLLLKMLILRDSPVGRIPEQYEYEDYKKAGAFLLPFTTRCLSTSPGGSNFTRRLEEIHINAPVKDQEFVMPAQPQSATSGGQP